MAGPRILFVEPYGQIGGSERYLQTLLEHLPASWIDTVVCMQDGPFPDLLRSEDYAVEMLPTSASKVDMASAAARFRRLARRSRPSLVHANGLKAALVAGAGLLGMHVPLVWIKHDFSWDGPLAHVGARLSTVVVGVSEAVTAVFAGRASMRKVRTVHVGIDIPAIDHTSARSELLRALGREEPVRVVALMGRLHAVKGHGELVRIAPRLIELVPDVHFAFIGGEDPSVPGYAQRLKGSVADAGLRERFSFLGFRGDATTLVAGSDVLALPSGKDERGMGKEAFPLAALEALSVGVPVVAYSDGGVPELVGDCGTLVTPGDRTALTDSLTRALSDARVRDDARRCGPERIKERFNLTESVAKMAALYEEFGAR